MKKLLKFTLPLILTFLNLSACGSQDILSPIENTSEQEVNSSSVFGPKKLQIDVYTTYGTEQSVSIKGRVLEYKKHSVSSVDDSSLMNLYKSWLALESDEVKDVNVEIEFNGKVLKAKSDKEGLFEIKEPSPVKTGYVDISAVLGPVQKKKYVADQAFGTLTVQPKNDGALGIISDIDDTIQKSYITDKIKMIKTLFLGNEYTIKVVPGVSEIYQVLDKKSDGVADGDVYYVSGSPINLFLKISRFMALHKFPKGSIELKNIGTDSLTQQIGYKLGRIRKIFDTYPNKKFLLFGDSGEKDPEVYRQIAKDYPSRVIATYINNVTSDSKTSPRYDGQLLTNNSLEAAQDLIKRGLLSQSDIDFIKKANS